MSESREKILKAISVLKSGTTNPIIISDMAGVLDREFTHMGNTMDMQEYRINELLDDIPDYHARVIEAVDSLFTEGKTACTKGEVIQAIKEVMK